MTHWQYDLECTAFNRSQLPEVSVSEVAVVGRSNVGKSTLINALLNRTSKKIAHVSSKPGKTRSLNFYRIKPLAQEPQTTRNFRLVDLPGYGYAARGKDERESWWRLIGDYFDMENRVTFVVHLVDFRHGPLANDDELTAWLDEIDMPRLIVFTKGDKVPKGKAKALYRKYLADGLVSITPPFVTCGKNDAEVDRLRNGMTDILRELEKMDG